MTTLLIGASVFFVGLVIFFVACSREKGWGVAVGFLMFIGSYLVVTALHEPKVAFRNLLTDVNLQEVSLSGENTFTAEIKIVYKDGKVYSVALVPKTTKKIPQKEQNN